MNRPGKPRSCPSAHALLSSTYSGSVEFAVEPALRWGRVFRRKNAFSPHFVIRQFILRRLVTTFSRRWGIRSRKAYAAQKRSEVAVIPSLALHLVRMIFFFLLTVSFPLYLESRKHCQHNIPCPKYADN